MFLGLASVMESFVQRKGQLKHAVPAWVGPETRCGRRSAVVALAKADMFAGGLMESAVAVSYTHLDVYKRQPC